MQNYVFSDTLNAIANSSTVEKRLRVRVHTFRWKLTCDPCKRKFHIFYGKSHLPKGKATSRSSQPSLLYFYFRIRDCRLIDTSTGTK